MAARPWSPIVWKEGLRLAQNFLSSQFIALDFDNGELTLSRAKELLGEMGVSYILGTSKSHQLTKTSASGVVTPACDRFRVVMMWERPITSREVFEYNMRFNMGLWPCDPSCKDAARFFFPCREIVAVNRGSRIEICDVPTEENREVMKQRIANRMKEHRENGTMPSWISAAISEGVEEGGRHVMCYRLGANLSKLGYPEEEIVAAIMRGPLGVIGRQDVERAVCNGAERARNE